MNEFALSFIAITNIQRQMKEAQGGAKEETIWRLPRRKSNTK